jgi:hypothetical protein
MIAVTKSRFALAEQHFLERQFAQLSVFLTAAGSDSTVL